MFINECRLLVPFITVLNIIILCFCLNPKLFLSGEFVTCCWSTRINGYYKLCALQWQIRYLIGLSVYVTQKWR